MLTQRASGIRGAHSDVLSSRLISGPAVPTLQAVSCSSVLAFFPVSQGPWKRTSRKQHPVNASIGFLTESPQNK